MKPKHIFVFILITLINHRLAAQKHELQIGIPGTFYFNEIAPRLTSLKAIPIPTHFAYSFTLKNDYKIRTRYDYYWINYNYPYLEIPNNTIIARRFSEYSIGVGKKWMDLTERIELGYNSNLLYRRGTELYHRYYYIHWGGITSRLEGLPYNDLGLDLGGQINYKFTKYFGVGFTASYARYFSWLSPNTLRFVMFTSIGF